MLTSSGYIAANAAESSGAESAPEATGNFLLNFRYSKVSFGEIVVERDVKIIHERRRLVRVFARTIQKIAGRGLLYTAASTRYFSLGRGRIGTITASDERFVTVPKHSVHIAPEHPHRQEKAPCEGVRRRIPVSLPYAPSLPMPVSRDVKDLPPRS